MYDEKVSGVGKSFGCYGVTKNYGKKHVLNSVSFNCKNGIVGIFGLNGSGKTTLLKILSGLDGFFKGLLYKTDFEDIAYMSVENYYPCDARIKDVIELGGCALKNQRTDKIYEELKAADINPKSLIRGLSTGMRQYVKFLLTVYSGASVCLFDEPLSNLDVNMRAKIIHTLISEITDDKLFVITTHEIKEIERLIDGFYILKNGSLSEYLQCDEIIAATGESIEDFYKENVNAKN